MYMSEVVSVIKEKSYTLKTWNRYYVTISEKKPQFFSLNFTVFQTSEDLKPKDLSKLAQKIRADNMRIIAIEQFEMDDTDIDIIAANCRDKT